MLIGINLYQLAGTTKLTGWMEFQPVGFALPYSCSFCSGSAADRICGIVKGLCHAAGILRGIRSCTTLRTAVPAANSYFGMENGIQKRAAYINSRPCQYAKNF